MENKKYYSVTYRVWGADRAETAWFDNETAADEFYRNRNHVDEPVMHQARAAETIKKYKDLCKLSIKPFFILEGTAMDKEEYYYYTADAAIFAAQNHWNCLSSYDQKKQNIIAAKGNLEEYDILWNSDDYGKDKVTVAIIKESDCIDAEDLEIKIDKQFNVWMENNCENANDNIADAFKQIYQAWGNWETFRWTAEYDETTGKIIKQ